MKPSFTIFEVNNGVVVVRPHPMQEGNLYEVFESPPDCLPDAYRLGMLEMAEKVMYTLLDAMEWRYDDHEKFNLTIKIEGKQP